MAEVPGTAEDFRNWLERHRGEMAPELLEKAERVRLSLDAIAGARKPAAREALARASAADMRAFVEAWAQHRAGGVDG